MNYNDALILFGLTDNYTKEELKKRYLELSKKHHPDLNGDEEMMKKVNAAYDLLKNSNYKSYFAENLNKFEKYKSKIKYPDGSLEEYYKILINRLIDTYGKNIVIGFEERIIYNEIQDMYREYMNKILVREEIYDMIQIDFDQDFDSFVKELNKIVNSFSVLNLKKYKNEIEYPKGSIEALYAKEINFIIQSHDNKKRTMIRQKMILDSIKEKYQKYETEILKRAFITDIIDINYEQNFDGFVKDLKDIVDNHIVTKTKNEIDRVAKRAIGSCSITTDFPNLVEKIKQNTFVTLIDHNFEKTDELIAIMKKYLLGWVDIYYKRKMLLDLAKDNNLEDNLTIQSLTKNLTDMFRICNYVEACKTLNTLCDNIQNLITMGVEVTNVCNDTRSILKNNFKNKMRTIIDTFDEDATEEIGVALQIYNIANKFIDDVSNGVKNPNILDKIKEIEFDSLEEIDELKFESLKKAIYVLDGDLENGSPFAKVANVRDGKVKYFGFSENSNSFYVMKYEDFIKNYKPIGKLLMNADFIGKRSSIMTGIHLYKIGKVMISLSSGKVAISKGPLYTRYKDENVEGIDKYKNKDYIISEVTKYVNGLYIKMSNEKKKNFSRKRLYRSGFDE